MEQNAGILKVSDTGFLSQVVFHNISEFLNMWTARQIGVLYFITKATFLSVHAIMKEVYLHYW